MEKIWAQQDISDALKQQLRTWAVEVNDVLHRSSNGKMISEWAKKAECREAVLSAKYSAPADDVPEVA